MRPSHGGSKPATLSQTQEVQRFVHGDDPVVEQIAQRSCTHENAELDQEPCGPKAKATIVVLIRHVTFPF